MRQLSFALLFAIYQTSNVSNGGVQSITEVLTRLEHSELTVWTNLESERTRLWRDRGISVRVEPNFGRGWRRKAGYVRNNIRAFSECFGRLPAVLHCNDVTSVLNFALGARLAGARVLFNVRDTQLFVKMPWHWFAAYALSDRVLVLSRSMRSNVRRALESAGVNRDVSVIYSGIDLEKFRPVSGSDRATLRRRLELDPKAFVVSVVAAMSKKKQQLELLESVPANWVEHGGWKLCLVGDFRPQDDAYAAACVERVNSRRLGEHVVFAGPSSEPWSWYQASDVVLVVSEREGLARCMIEGLACGVPVISFPVASADEVLRENDCGVVVGQGDFDAVWRALTRLRENDEERRRLAANARAAAEVLFDAGAAARKYTELYETLASLRR